MEVIIKKTTELTEQDIQDFLSCFKEAFDRDRTVREFKNEYLNTYLGYSWHSLLYNDSQKLCGCICLVPFLYQHEGREFVLVFGGDLMIVEAYRKDFKNVGLMVSKALKFLKENGAAAWFGFPNDNSEILNRVFIKSKRVAYLDTFILPTKVGDYKNSLSLLNPFSQMFAWMLLQLSRIPRSKELFLFSIQKKRPIFEETRYKWYNPEEYQHYRDNNFHCIWKVTEFEGTKACFLMDVYPLSRSNFETAVKKMYEAEKSSVGIFLYVGLLPFKPFSMVKIPKKFEPKKFRFDVKVLDGSFDEKEFYDAKNWEMNLSSYDLL